MNPKCPYCGAEMRREWCGFYYECPKCFSQSPYVEKGSTRAAAMKRYVEPNGARPLRLDEACEQGIAFCEFRADGNVEPCFVFRHPEYDDGILLKNAHEQRMTVAYDSYFYTWRLWSARPTDEERSAAKWEDMHEFG